MKQDKRVDYLLAENKDLKGKILRIRKLIEHWKKKKTVK